MEGLKRRWGVRGNLFVRKKYFCRKKIVCWDTKEHSVSGWYFRFEVKIL